MNVAVMCNTKSSEYPNRPELIEMLVKNGHRVYFGVIDDGVENDYFRTHENVECFKIKATRNNTNPLKELASLWDIRKCTRREKIDCAVIYGIKNHPAMALGSRLGGVKKIICVVNGRGNLFSIGGWKGAVLRCISGPMLKVAYKASHIVCFQNPDDAVFFVEKRLVKKDKIVLMNGSGVNLREFPFSEMPKEERFLFLSRITPSKGIGEFIKAAEIVKKSVPGAVFDVVGPVDDLVEGSCMEMIKKADEEGIIKYHGATTDVAGWMEKARYFVYPSYREGTPRCVLQAMSTGRPVITSDAPGCRETVVNGENGYLVKPADAEELARAMIDITKDPERASGMGRMSRVFAEEKFDIDKVNGQMVSLI